MKQLIVECPINSLSFGQVSVNILRELYKQNIDCIIFPIGQIDISVYDKLSQGFKNWLQDGINKRLTSIRRDIPVLKIYHLNGSHNKVSDNQYLLTFYECDQPTKEELAMVNLQQHVFFPTQYNIDVFSTFGTEDSKMTRVPMGFDPDMQVIPNSEKSDKIEFGLIGKWEKRKNTSFLINSWVRKFGNDKRYVLNLAVTNPFLSQQHHDQLMLQALDGKSVDNLNPLQYIKTNTGINMLMNFIDIDLGGMSSAEGWNLPSFNMTALGKWSTVLNASAHKEWATKDNSLLVEPSGMQPIYDGVFFQPGQPWNQGNSFSFNEDEYIAKLEEAITKAKTINTEGLKLQKEFTWKKTVDIMLKKIFQ